MPLYPYSNAPKWTKVTKSYADFSASAITNDIEIYSLLAGEVLHNVIIKHSSAFDESTVPVTGEVVGVGDGIVVTFPISLNDLPVNPLSISITDTVETFTDNGLGVLTGDQGGTGTINYLTGVGSVTFNSPPTLLQNITADYTQNGVVDYAISVGIPANFSIFAGSFSVYSAPSGTSFGVTAITSPAPEDFTAATSIRAQATSNGADLDEITAGDVDFYLQISQLPL